jgi:hypothetical protein
MIKKLAFAAFVAVTSAAFAQTFPGNGATGFGGALGNSSLSISDSGGVLNFSLGLGSGGTGFNASNNDIVLYLDSTAGGFGDNSTFNDNGDGGREAISGANTSNASRALLTFAPGFTADYAIAIDSAGNGNLFQLASGGNNSLTFVSGINLSQTGNTLTFNLPLTSLGLTQGQSFNFVGSLISQTAFRSNETIGTSVTTPDTLGDAPNAGFNGTTTFATFDTYTTAAAVPEPATVLLVAPTVLAGMFYLRRRRA